MAPVELDGSVAAFIEAVSQLSRLQFEAVYEAGLQLDVERRISASEKTVLSSSAFSLLDRQVRDAVRTAWQGDRAGIRRAVSDTLIAAQAIAKRTALSRDEYEIAVAPFAGVPAPIPAHPDAPPSPDGFFDGALMSPPFLPPRRRRVWAGVRVALEVREEPGILVSASAPPPPPDSTPASHPFAAAIFRTAEDEGVLGALLRESADFDAFLAAAVHAGYTVSPY